MDFFSVRIAPQKLLIALGVVVSLFISAFDSFRLSSASGHASGDAATALLSPLYPMTTGSIAQDAIATVFVTQDSLDKLDVDTPYPSYPVQAELVDLLAQERPTAIFLDFSYKRWKNEAGIKALAESIAAAQARGVPVLTGPISPLPVFEPLRAAAVETDIDWLNSDRIDYPFDGLRRPPFAEKAGTVTPAKRLYDIICARDSARRYYKCDLAGASPKADIAVEWARGAHPDLGAWWGEVVDQCPKTNRGPGGGVSLFVTALSRNLFHSLALEEGTGVDQCTYHLSTPLHYVILNQGGAKRVARSTATPALPEDLRGRVVMVGLQTGDDQFLAPGQGMTPGVLHHAMALDNLLSRGSTYRRSPGALAIGFERDPAKRPLQIGYSSLIEIALSLIIGFLVSNVIHARDGTGVKLGRSVAAGALVVAIPLAVAVFADLVLHWTVLNVFGIGASALGVTALLEWERSGDIRVKWVLVAALAAAAALTGLVAAYVASSASAGITIVFAVGLFALAVLAAVMIPHRGTEVEGGSG